MFRCNNTTRTIKINIYTTKPVAGGLVAAVVSLLVHTFWGYSIVFSSELQTSFMLVFFASIG
ncbi:hypothetical protein IAF53_20775, partial [Acinetobacter baumannii]|nr:hypothetical protein [Acinetobacter baumannii]